MTVIEKNGIYYREDVTFRSNKTQVEFLLADDSRFMRKSLAQTVRSIGGKVVGEATTSSEAISMFTHLRSDIVTMDISMPGVSGIEAIKIILQIDPNVSIIVISGADLQEVREQVFNLGVKMFITKPFDPKEVATILISKLSVSE